MPARNISEYPQLLNAIHSAEKIVYLCGAGASMSLGSHRLSWTNWIAEGRKYLTIPEQNELNLKIGSWTAEELIDAATFLLGKLKSSGAYQTFMNQTIGALHPVNTEFKEALCKVWRAGDLIATTNYDTQIEETLNAKGVSYECPAEILSIIRSTAENKVIHLHGMYDERDGIDNIIADYIRFLKEISEKVTIRDEAVDAIEAYCVGLHNAEAVDEYGAFLKKCGELTQLLADNKRIAVICCQNYGRLMHLRLYKNVNAEIQEEWNAIVEILKQCNYDEDVYKNVLDAVEEYFRTLVQRKKEDKLFELERFMAQVYEENGRCEAAEVAALCLANLYNSGGHRKITPDEYETIKKYLQKFPESMHIRAAFIIASEAIYSPSAEYKRVPDKIINKAKQWSEQYPKKIEFQEAYFGLLFSRLKYAQAQDMRNEQRRVYREMKTVAERANYSEYNESNQLMESVDILHRVFGY